MSIDFNELCQLFKSDPEAFERLREREIEKLIESSSERSRNRLRGLQFQIDAKRTIYQDKPYLSCMEISKMMHTTFNELNDQLSVFRKSHPFSNNTIPQNAHTQSAEGNVLEFRR